MNVRWQQLAVVACSLFTVVGLAEDGGGESLNERRAVHACLQNLLSKDEDVRERAEEDLRRFGTNALPAAMSYVTSFGSAFSSHDSSIAYHAFRILGAEARPAIPALTKYANDPNYCRDASLALCLIGSEGIAPIAASLTNTNLEIQGVFLERLRSCGLNPDLKPFLQQAVPRIQACVTSSDELVSVTAMATLFAVSTNSTLVVHTLMPNLQAENGKVRGAAATYISLCGSPAKIALPALVTLWQDKDPKVRESVAQAIVTIDPVFARENGVKLRVYE